MRKKELTEMEIRAILMWLKAEGRYKWVDGSRNDIERIYNELNDWVTTPVSPRKWRWKKYANK